MDSIESIGMPASVPLTEVPDRTPYSVSLRSRQGTQAGREVQAGGSETVSTTQRDEQEKQIGPLINQIVNALPPEKRKGYLFQPNTMFTYQTLIDRVLEADGITKEMVEAQQKRVNLLQRLLTTANAEDRATIIRQENELADGELFTILSTLIQTSAAQGDETGAKMLAQIQNELLKETVFGRKLLADSQETQAALKELDKANKEGLTREKLLDVLSSVKSESSLITLVSVTRTGLDYQFFQVLSERIEASEGDGKQSLIALRDKLLKLTREIDLEMKKRLENAVTLVESILKEEDAQAAIEKHAQEIDEFFSQAVQMEFEKAREENDLARIEKIQKLISVIEKMTAPPAEVEFLQTLLETREENERARLLDEKIELVNDQFLQTINSIIAEGESHKQSPELLEELKSIYKLALRKSMEKNLKS